MAAVIISLLDFSPDSGLLSGRQSWPIPGFRGMRASYNQLRSP